MLRVFPRVPGLNTRGGPMLINLDHIAFVEPLDRQESQVAVTFHNGATVDLYASIHDFITDNQQAGDAT